MHQYRVISDHLQQRYGLSAEELLLAGCIVGRIPDGLAHTLCVDGALVDAEMDEDGSDLWTYRGALAVEGRFYRFTLHVYGEPEQPTALADLSALEPINIGFHWQRLPH